MEVVKINRINSKPGYRFLKGLVHVFWVAIHQSVWRTAQAEFGGQEDLTTFSRTFKPSQLLLLVTTLE